MGTASLPVRRVLRKLVSACIRLFYRIELREGAIPSEGPALVVANHTAYVDPFVLVACTTYPLRFVYWHALDRVPFVGWFCRFSGGIPIAGARERPDVFEAAMRAIDEALARGEVVVVFPEGALTRDGAVAPFKKGIERIVEARPTRVVPVAIEGLWGSVFSRAPKKRARQIRPRVLLWAGPPIEPHAIDADALRDTVLALRPISV